MGVNPQKKNGEFAGSAAAAAVCEISISGAALRASTVAIGALIIHVIV